MQLSSKIMEYAMIRTAFLAGFMDAAQMIKMGKTTFANGISKMN